MLCVNKTHHPNVVGQVILKSMLYIPSQKLVCCCCFFTNIYLLIYLASLQKPKVLDAACRSISCSL